MSTFSLEVYCIRTNAQGRSDGGYIGVYTPKSVTVLFTCGTLTHVLKLQWLVKTYTPQSNSWLCHCQCWSWDVYGGSETTWYWWCWSCVWTCYNVYRLPLLFTECGTVIVHLMSIFVEVNCIRRPKAEYCSLHFTIVYVNLPVIYPPRWRLCS